jgi:F-type H+-transporting ATPase subunit a
VTWLFATEAGINDPWVVPDPITELFEFPALLFEDTLLAINRTVLILLFASLFASALFFIAFRKPKVVPGKLQNACEAIIDFIREQVVLQVMGNEGRAFLPFLTTIFVFVWMNNLFEIIPMVNFPPTSRMAIPAMLALLIWLVFIAVGMAKQGPRYFWNVAFPPGVPKPIYLLITPIEIVSTFVVRPLTLAVRLFANMVAGHILLTLVFLTVHAFLFSGRGTPVGVVALVASPLLIGFELVVGVLQAYIMTILAAVYIGSSIHPEH